MIYVTMHIFLTEKSETNLNFVCLKISHFYVTSFSLFL